MKRRYFERFETEDSQRVQLDCQYEIRAPKPYDVWFLGPNSILAVGWDPLG